MPDIREGLVAYSAKQTAVADNLAKRFADEWYSLLAVHGLKTEWPEEYLRGKERLAHKLQEVRQIDDDEDIQIEDDIFE